MDALKKVISSKKAELGGRRWVRQAELRAVREREAEAAYGRKKRRVAEEETDEPEASSPQEPPPEEGAVREEAPEEKDDDDEFRLTGAYAIRNTFLGGDDEARRPGQRDDDDDVEEDDDDEEDEPRAKKVREEKKKPPSEDAVIRRWIRARLKDWERKLEARPDAEKRSPLGRVDTKTYKQCKDYIRPLVKLCKTKTLDAGIRGSVAKICRLCDDGDFVAANDEYILLAIGNAAWPIGVTSIGIHTRTARENVEQKNVAHVMNNEMQRKYLTSVKRLIKLAQDLRPDLPPSRKVL